MTNAQAINAADQYRGYGAAIRLVSGANPEDLKLKSRIVSYLYDQGHSYWLQLVKLDCPEFAHAFDASRAKR